MTSKTFKTVGNIASRLIHVENIEQGVNIFVSDSLWREDYGITIAPSDAPALALAILEAAGYKIAQQGDMDEVQAHVANALYHLGCAIEAQKRVTAEARELENAGRDAAGADRIEELSEMGRAAREFILAVARRARELAKEATK